MKKNYGVCLGMLAMGLAVLGVPASKAQSRLAADEAGGGSEPTATSSASPSSSPTASSPADLQQRIDALKAELADLNSQLAAEKDQEPATAPGATQDQGTPAPATPAQTPTPAPAAAAPAAPTPLASPSMSAPLSTAIPHEIGGGPFGKLEVTGILSGMGWTEGDYVQGDSPTHWELSNAQVFVQKTTGWWQFYLQAGAYNIPDLGFAFVPTGATITGLWGPFPQGYLKLVKGNFNVEVGALPTLIGAEYTFDFENMNIERGLLWNQENAVNRGIQLSDTYKKLSVSFSWNDGFYSSRYSWLTGSAALAFNAANTLTFVAGGNAGSYAKSTFATPLLQNNSEIYNLIYMYSKGNLMVMPYFQYTDVPANAKIGIPAGASTRAGAILFNYNFKHGVSLALRPEYISQSGSTTSNAASLLYGPGSKAFSFTVTPTYQKDGFFLRGDFSIVHLSDFGTGLAFGTNGMKDNQARGVVEAGFMF